MRTLAAVIPQPQAPVAVEEITVPSPGPGEVLVRMEACGLCHSDLMIAGLAKLPLAPLVLGHEGIGRVVEVGPDVRGVARGERVGITFLDSSCGECDFCRDGRERFCARQVNTGYTRHGAMAGYALGAAQNLVRVPETLAPAAVAPLCCAGWTAYCAIRETGLHAEQSVAIYGLGGLGHLGLQYARRRGLRVAGVDVVQAKLEFARKLGAEAAFPSEGSGRALQKQWGGVDAAVVFTATPEAVGEAVRSLRRTGTLVLVGLSTRAAELSVQDAVLKGLTIRGSYLGTRADLEEVFRLAAEGVGLPHVETFALAQAPRLLEEMRAGRLLGRAVVVF